MREDYSFSWIVMSVMRMLYSSINFSTAVEHIVLWVRGVDGLQFR